jgi:integrase
LVRTGERDGSRRKPFPNAFCCLASARDIVAAIIEGKPLPERHGGTLADIAERYIAEILPKKRTAKACEQALRREVLPVIGPMPTTSIAHEDLVRLFSGIADRSPHAARKAHAELSVLFKWATFNRLGGLRSNPMSAIPVGELMRGRRYSKVRARVLEDRELRLIWRAASETPYPFGPLVKALILTGQRLNEIASAQWSEITPDATTLLIPPERMKNKLAHAVPLTAQMGALLDGLPHFVGGGYLFSTTAGARPFQGFSKAKAKLDAAVAAIGSVGDWQLHDIRRSARTGLARSGVSVFIAELVIGHQQSGVHGVYDRFRYHQEKLDALLHWETLLFEQILKEPPGNAVKLAAAG